MTLSQLAIQKWHQTDVQPAVENRASPEGTVANTESYQNILNLFLRASKENESGDPSRKHFMGAD